MSKGQHGNREAKKPKKLKVPETPLAPVVIAPGRLEGGKKK